MLSGGGINSDLATVVTYKQTPEKSENRKIRNLCFVKRIFQSDFKFKEHFQSRGPVNAWKAINTVQAKYSFYLPKVIFCFDKFY